MQPMRQRQAQEVQVDAPIGGWNTRESIDNMPPTDAVILDNWIPDLGSVNARPGSGVYCTVPLSEDVKTLIVYDKGIPAGSPGGRKFFAFHGSSCTDITSPPLTSTISAIGVTDARWQSAQFDGKLVIVNGTDCPFMYNGTNWYSANTVGGEFPLSVDGSTATADVYSLSGVNVFKNRTWFWKADSQDVWYSALNTMGGALTKFPESGSSVGA